MRRFSKFIALGVACLAALILTVRNGNDGLRVSADSHLRAATRSRTKYDLSQLPIFSRTLFYVGENYFDKNRLDPRRMLVGALDFPWPFITGVRPPAFPARPTAPSQRWAARGSPGSRAWRFHACKGSPTARGRWELALALLPVLPSV